MSFFLKWVGVRVCPPEDLNLLRLQLNLLAFPRRGDQGSGDAQGAPSLKFDDLRFVVGQTLFSDYLNVAQAGTVVHLNERKTPFGVPLRANPPVDVCLFPNG